MAARQLLEDNIISFWADRMYDPEGGFYGRMDRQNILHRDAERGIIGDVDLGLNLPQLSTSTKACSSASASIRSMATPFSKVQILELHFTNMYMRFTAQRIIFSQTSHILATWKNKKNGKKLS